MVQNREEDIVIVSALRTPIGNFSGAFATLPAHKLGETHNIHRTLIAAMATVHGQETPVCVK